MGWNDPNRNPNVAKRILCGVAHGEVTRTEDIAWAKMHGHFIDLCVTCDVVVDQCYCPGNRQEIRTRKCDRCNSRPSIT